MRGAVTPELYPKMCYKPPEMQGTQEILIVAGEASADAHSAEVLSELKALHPGLRAFGVGGPGLRRAGLEAIHRAEEISVMGIWEVLPRLPRIFGIMRKIVETAKARRPQVALLVDLPDFNLRLAKKLKKLGIPVVYFISPMVWAWRPGRTRQIARRVNRMLCILPFEEDFYAGRGVPARFVGNPLADRPPPATREQYRREIGLDTARTTVALVPGSRSSELARLFPPMLEAAERLRCSHPDAQFVVPVAPTLSHDEIQRYLDRHHSLQVKLVDRTDAAVGASDVALVKSGTATLEAGLMRRPMVVAYKTSWLTYLVGRMLVKVAHVALVNLLAGRRLVPELLQKEAHPARMAEEVERLLGDRAACELQVAGLVGVRQRLGQPGAAKRVAEEVARYVEGRAA
jgi:lipid-A-disaccharide synthase